MPYLDGNGFEIFVTVNLRRPVDLGTHGNAWMI